jgi:polyhydroxybutyrate depolymerase
MVNHGGTVGTASWGRRHRRALGGALAASLCSSGLVLGMAAPSFAASAVTAMTGASSRSGCGSAQVTGSTTFSITVNRRRRSVIVHLPVGYTGTTKVPLVLNLHGSGSTAAQQEVFSGMDATSDADEFIVAYPQGAIRSGSGFDWNVPNEPLVGGKFPGAGAANDVAFLTDLVGLLEQRYCISPTRVYATGFSGGARMASQLACDASGTFAAVAPVSGLRHPTPCRTTRPVPVIAFHGTADPVDPYNGHGERYWTYSVPQAARDWAHQNHCSGGAATSRPTSGATLTQYRGCAGGATVELYTLLGEGHEWPGGPKLPRALTRVLGPQTQAVDANTTMWAFFAAHPKP